MASNSGRGFVQRSASTVRAFFSHKMGKSQSMTSVASGSSKLSGLLPSNPSRLSRSNYRFLFSRLPTELASSESLLPLHSATSSALLKSLLSSKVGQWSCLSEGFATPL